MRRTLLLLLLFAPALRRQGRGGRSVLGSEPGPGSAVFAPPRDSPVMSASTSGALTALREWASHSIFLPAQTARLPKSTVSVSGPA